MLGVNRELFYEWLINEHHYASDGIPISIIKTYIDTEDKINEFFNYYRVMYNCDPEYINSCLFETVELYRELEVGQEQLLTEIV